MCTWCMLAGIISPGLYKGLSKQESLELGFEYRQTGEILQTGRQQIPDRLSDETERALAKMFQITFRNFQKQTGKQQIPDRLNDET